MISLSGRQFHAMNIRRTYARFYRSLKYFYRWQEKHGHPLGWLPVISRPSEHRLRVKPEILTKNSVRKQSRLVRRLRER